MSKQNDELMDNVNGESEVEEYTQESEKASEKGGGFVFCLKIGCILLAVCAAVTLALAVVNAVTADKIAENKTKDITLAINAIFKDADSSLPAEGVSFEAPITAVYKVMNGDKQIGHAVCVISDGFGGDIEMLVGVNAGGKVAGVRIISLSETPGVGSRVNDDNYLSGYIGKSGNLVLRSDVDGISGATISSKAVLAGVNSALALKLKLEGGEDIGERIDPVESETEDTDAPIPADPGLDVSPVEDDVPGMSVETVFRDETEAPESQPEETVIISVVTEPSETTAPAGEPAETTGEPDVTSASASEPTGPAEQPESGENSGSAESADEAAQ